MSEEERERIAGRVVLDLARKKKDLACLKSKASQMALDIGSVVGFLEMAGKGNHVDRSRMSF